MYADGVGRRRVVMEVDERGGDVGDGERRKRWRDAMDE
jgi:hypothetical protein